MPTIERTINNKEQVWSYTMKRRVLFFILAISTGLTQMETVKASAVEFMQYQFINCGVEFGHKDIPIEARGKMCTMPSSPPSIDTPQRILQVEHPEYVLEKVFKKVGGKDGRERIKDTTEWPYSVFGQLKMKFPDGVYQGSGTLVSPHHVLTCAHNVYDPEKSLWASKVELTPALNETQAPFGVIPVISAFVYKTWIESGDSTADIALLTLAQPIGKKTGWAGIITTEDTLALKMEKPEITGYPGDKTGTQMWTMFHRFKSISDTQFTYVIDTYAGQSGSGVWIAEHGEPYLLGVHISGNIHREENIGTRISKKYFELLHEKMSRTGDLRAALLRPVLLPIVPPSRPADPSVASIVPDIAKGHEEEYLHFLRGKLIYKPDPNSDAGKIEFPIAALANPLGSTFDISRCGDSGQYLSFATGYRKGKNPANENKFEVWIVPRFLVEKELGTTAGHFRAIMDKWLRTEPVGLIFTWGNCDNLNCFSLIHVTRPDVYSLANYDPRGGGTRACSTHSLTAAAKGRYHPGLARQSWQRALKAWYLPPATN